MSIIRAIKNQLGLSVTPANNFVLDASADNGTMKLARESGQDIMTVDAAGKVAFPQLAQSLSPAGYVTLPNGIIIQWGTAVISTTAANTWEIGGTQPYPIPFPNAVLAVVGNVANTHDLSYQGVFGSVYPSTTQPLIGVGSQVMSTASALPNIPLKFIAIGY